MAVRARRRSRRGKTLTGFDVQRWVGLAEKTPKERGRLRNEGGSIGRQRLSHGICSRRQKNEVGVPQRDEIWGRRYKGGGLRAENTRGVVKDHPPSLLNRG